MTPETSRIASLIGCGHEDRGRCGGGLLGFWLDSLDETGQKQDSKLKEGTLGRQELSMGRKEMPNPN